MMASLDELEGEGVELIVLAAVVIVIVAAYMAIRYGGNLLTWIKQILSSFANLFTGLKSGGGGGLNPIAAGSSGGLTYGSQPPMVACTSQVCTGSSGGAAASSGDGFSLPDSFYNG